MNWFFTHLYWLLHPKSMAAMREWHRQERRYYDERLVREIAPVIGMPIWNIENWPDERVRWSVEHILSMRIEKRQ